jgi:hypothetical protein
MCAPVASTARPQRHRITSRSTSLLLQFATRLTSLRTHLLLPNQPNRARPLSPRTRDFGLRHKDHVRLSKQAPTTHTSPLLAAPGPFLLNVGMLLINLLSSTRDSGVGSFSVLISSSFQVPSRSSSRSGEADCKV